MEWWRWLIVAGVLLGVLLGVFLLQRLLLIRWRFPTIRFEGKGGTNALQPLGDILDPSTKHIHEVQEHIRKDEEEPGAPPR
jgi:hypothetical protein